MLPTTTVGSFPKPDYLQKARTQHSLGKITAAQLHELELRATREVIRQ
jgi:5-methyltetrahydropteroyltriglutamate--homocysteine methyltransferase